MSTADSVEAARRQQFGAMFEQTPRDQALVEQLLSGDLTLRPHPSWMLPRKIDLPADPFLDRNSMSQYHMPRWMDPLPRRGIASAIEPLADALGVGRIVLQGGSGGGFAALQVGAHIPESHVVAISPQTDLSRHSYRFYPTRRSRPSAWRRRISLLSLLPRVHAVRRLGKLQPQLEATLVMNSGDLLRQRDPAAPLRELYASHTKGDLTDVRFDIGPGHLPLGNEQYEGVMRRLCSRRRRSC